MSVGTERKQEINEAKARAHLSAIALGLREVLGSGRAAAAMMGPVIGLLEEAGGKEYVATFLRELADEIDRADDITTGKAH